MKVLLLSTSSSRNAGGLYNSVRHLGKSLIRHEEIDPIVLAFKDEYSEVDIDAYVPLPIMEYNIVGPAGFAYSRDLKHKIEQINPDIIHVQGIYLYSSYINNNYAKKTNKPYLISPRGMLDPWILKTRAWKKKIGLNLYERQHLANASCIQALGIPEYNAIRSFGCKNPIAVIPNGVNLPSNASTDELKQMPAPWVNDERKTLLFLSRLHPKKGIENLMHAWSQLGSEREEWKLVVAGESKGDEYTRTLVQLQNKLHLDNDVFFIGPQYHSDKEVCFRNSDAFILPSFGEGMPMSVLEAWSYNLPALITDGCNIPEGFEYNAALRIETNPDSILAGLQQLFAMSDQQRNHMGNQGYQLIKDKFTWSSIAQQMKDVYNWVLNGAPAPSCVMFN